MKRGVVYTPNHWADWVVDRFHIAEKWIHGALILDPGCGTGALMEAVVRRALADGAKPDTNELERLIGMDVDRGSLDILDENFRQRYNLKLPPRSLIHGDFVLEDPDIQADIVLANPPWVSFGDLDSKLKEVYKPIYRKSGLIPDPRTLLLGGARIDLAALFVALSMERHLNQGGEGLFFLPSSLFRGEGAHKALRNLILPGGRLHRLEEVYDMEKGAPFPGAGTRKCLAYFRMGERQVWPISWYTAESGNTWKTLEARPVAESGSPLIPYCVGAQPPVPPRIIVPAETKPRQGVNTGGASAAFILEELGPLENGVVAVVNKTGIEGRLPKALVHPLMNPSSFESGDNPIPERWIFLPYNRNGHVMSAEELKSYPDAAKWLIRHRTLLESRKGVMLARYATGGIWWALLGVGPYAFQPWKIAWESYGRSRFIPMLFGPSEDGIWQGNQALHAFLSFNEEDTARRVLEDFQSPALEEYLRSLGGADTKGWAQPGRIRRILSPDTSFPAHQNR